MAIALESVAKDAPLKERISQALTIAEAGDSNSMEAQTLRLIACAVRDRDVTARGRGDCGGCPEAAVRDVLRTMVAQREVSAREYDESGRLEEAERERSEIEVIRLFLPEPLEGEALEAAVAAVVEDLEATKLKDVGRCMTELKARYPDQLINGAASKAVKKALG